MACTLSKENLIAAAARLRVPHAPETTGDTCDVRRCRAAGVTDILTISANPALVVYLSGLFRRYGWAIRRSVSLEGAAEFLKEHRAAVAIFEEGLPDGTWQDAARILLSVPNAPMIVVVGSARPQLDDVTAVGGFDVLKRPLRDAEVIWTVASAWHEWMNRTQSEEAGGLRCSDA